MADRFVQIGVLLDAPAICVYLWRRHNGMTLKYTLGFLPSKEKKHGFEENKRVLFPFSKHSLAPIRATGWEAYILDF